MLLLAGMQKGHFILVPTLQRNSNLKETFTKMVHIIFKAGFFFFFLKFDHTSQWEKGKKKKNKVTVETAVMEKISQDPPGVSGLIF